MTMASLEDVRTTGGAARLDTLLLHAGQETPDPTTDARAVPLYETTSYVFRDFDMAETRFSLVDPRNDGGNTYSRLMNPTVHVLEERMRQVEGASGSVAVASRPAALEGVVNAMADGGDSIVVGTRPDECLGHVLHDLSLRGIRHRPVDLSDRAALDAALADRTVKAALLDRSRPLMAPRLPLQDIAGLAHAHGVPLIVDASDAFVPSSGVLGAGADVVIVSRTVVVADATMATGAVVCENDAFDWTAGGRYPQFTEPDPGYRGTFLDVVPHAPVTTRIRAVLLHDEGACLDAFQAFLLLTETETVALEGARRIATITRLRDTLSRRRDVIGTTDVLSGPPAEGAPATVPSPEGSPLVLRLRAAPGALRRARKGLSFIRTDMVGDSRLTALQPLAISDPPEESWFALHVGTESSQDIIDEVTRFLDLARG